MTIDSSEGTKVIFFLRIYIKIYVLTSKTDTKEFDIGRRSYADVLFLT